MKIINRFICLVIILCMCLGMGSVVNAAGEGNFVVRKNGVDSGSYTTLANAVNACKNATASTKAVIVMNVDADLGSTSLQITGGVFTIDLNGHSIKAACDSSDNKRAAIYVDGTSVQLTIADSSEAKSGSITNSGKYAVYVNSGKALNIAGGTIVSSGTDAEAVVSQAKVVVTGGSIGSKETTKYGLYCYKAVEIRGGAVYGSTNAIHAKDNINVYDGVISGSGYGINGFKLINIYGGSISGGNKDIYYNNYNKNLNTNSLSGGTFPGDIEIYSNTLNLVLADGYAYWAGDTMLTVTDSATEIMDKGTITVKPICTHDPASVDETGRCACGTQFVASATVAGVTEYYMDLPAAFEAVKDCVADDDAVVKLLANVELGDSYLEVSSTVFTLDLNNFVISNTLEELAPIVIISAGNLTVIDSSEQKNGGIRSEYSVAMVVDYDSELTIEAGNMYGPMAGICAYGTLNMSGGCVEGEEYGIYIERADVSITGGEILSDCYALYVLLDSEVTITGGSISSADVEIWYEDSSVVLSLAEGETEGVKFPDGIELYKNTLNALLGEGMAYWQDGKQLTVADDATEITGGNVVVKAQCVHTGGQATCVSGPICELCSQEYGQPDSNAHTGGEATCQSGPICEHCGQEYGTSGDHIFNPETGICKHCPLEAIATVTIGDTVNWYLSIDDAFSSLSGITEDATVTLLRSNTLTKYFGNKSIDVDLIVKSGAILTMNAKLELSGDLDGDGTIKGSYTLNVYGDTNNITISNQCENYGTVQSGTFTGRVYNYGTISGGIFSKYLVNDSVITGGTFNDTVENNSGPITGGTFNGKLLNESAYVSGKVIPAEIINTEDPTNFTLGDNFTIKNTSGTIVCTTHIWNNKWVCRLCNAECEHTGGTATCESGKICERCSEEYTESLGHSYGEPVITWNDDNTASATVTCANDKTHVEELDVEVTSETTEGDCETPSMTTYTATVTFEDKTYTSTKEVEGELSACVDADKDHECDVCGENVGKHEDTDKDHDCEYGCSETIGSCEDKDNNGECDYGCGKEFEVEPDPTEPEPTEPKPTEPKPTEPKPTEPKPTEPKPTEPAPTEPEATEPEAPKVEGVTRLAGENRLVTSELIADQLKEKMGVEKFQNIIVASGATFADALPGSYLSGVKNAPILLTLAKDKYVNQTADYIKANLASGGTVYILGGESAVPASMEAALAGIKVQRVAGADRFGTNLAILKEAGVKAGDEILVCTAKEFADSLSASATGKPILLVYKKLTDEQKTYLATLSGCKFTVVGGTTAVPDSIAKEVETYGAVTRLAGKDRLETSTMVAEKYFADATTTVVAYGWNFPDGLCGGSLAYAMDAPLILTHSKEKLAKFTADYTTKAGLKVGYVLGGDGLVDDAATRAIFGMGSEPITVLS